jgi:hypothetical protein
MPPDGEEVCRGRDGERLRVRGGRSWIGGKEARAVPRARTAEV